MKKEKIECGGCGGIWGMSLALGRNLPGVGCRVGESKKYFSPSGGETSGFTTASTAKAMNALSGKGLACGGHPPQETAVFTAPPQNRSCEYSIRCLSIIYRNHNVRFMLTQVPPFTSDLLEEMQIMADQQQATGAISQGIL